MHNRVPNFHLDDVQTLMDEEKRSDYDSLIGFSRLAINPFRDSTFEADQVSSLILFLMLGTTKHRIVTLCPFSIKTCNFLFPLDCILNTSLLRFVPSNSFLC